MNGAAYESETLLAQYLLLHYGGPREISPHAEPPPGSLDFPARCARACIDATPPERRRRALDLGCAVGRAAFELAAAFPEVVAIDFSRRFVNACLALQREGRMAFRAPAEGDITTPCAAVVPPALPRHRVRFDQCDACRLPSGLGAFDAVLLANLIDRLSDPAACLERLPDLVATGGTLVITTPCTWLEEFTPRDRWIGGRDGAGGPITTADALHHHLGHDFHLTEIRSMPFLIREHARKFQWSVALAMIWRRKD